MYHFLFKQDNGQKLPIISHSKSEQIMKESKTHFRRVFRRKKEMPNMPRIHTKTKTIHQN